MPSPLACVSGSIRVALCGLLAVFPLSGCGVFFHDDGVEQQTSKALSTFQSGGLTSLGANKLSDQAKLDAAEVNANTALDQSMRRYDLARLLGDSRYIAAKCTGLKGRGAECPLLVFRDEVDQRRDALARNAVHTYANWQLLLFTGTAADSSPGSPPNPGDAIVMAEIDTYNSAVQQYKASGRTDFTSCQTFKDPHEPDNTPAENLFNECKNYLKVMKLKRPVDDVLAVVSANGISGRIPDVNAALKDRQQELEGLQQSEVKTADQLKDAQAKLTSTKTSGDSQAVQNRVRDILKILDDVDSGAATIGHPEFAPGAQLAAIKFRNTNLNAALHATVAAAAAPSSGAAPASGASAAAQGTGGDSTNNDLAIASIISGVTVLAENGGIGPPPPSSILDLQAKTLAGLQAAVQGQIDAVKGSVTELEKQRQAYVTEFVLLNAASNALDDAQKALAHTHCKATNVGEMLESRTCTAARVPLSEALTLYDRAWIEGRIPGGASDIRLTQYARIEQQSVQAATLDARVAVDTEALTALAGAGKSGIEPATIASFIQALATVVIAARIH